MAAGTAIGRLLICTALVCGVLAACDSRPTVAADRCNPGTAGQPRLPTVPGTTPLPADPTGSAAAGLRSGIDLLLHEQVDVLTAAVAAGLTPGTGSARARTAGTVLRWNADALSAALAGCDSTSRGELRSALRARSMLLWRHGALLRRARSTTASARQLGTVNRRIGRLLARMFGASASAMVHQDMDAAAGLLAAVEAASRRSPSWPAAAARASGAADGTAAIWAAGVVRRDHLPDGPDTAASRLRSDLTTLLVGRVGAVLHAVLAISGAHVAADTALHGALAEMDADADRIGSLSAGRPATAAASELSQLWQHDDQQLVTFAAAALRHQPAEQLRASAQTLEQTERQFAVAYGRDLPATSVAAVFTTLQGPTHALEVAMVDVVAHKPKASWDVAAAEDGMAGLAAVLAKAVMLEGQPA